MPDDGPLYSIVLAAGKGQRMRTRDKHKVCFEVGGIPAIVRALDCYNRLGVVQNVVVVGDLAGQVVETVGKKFSNVVFAYQPEALGTGDAARCGLQALAGVDGHARILVVAGDKIIESRALSRLIKEFGGTSADLCILAAPIEYGHPSAGRILMENGRPSAIAETADIRLRACRAELCEQLAQLPFEEVSPSQVEEIVDRHLGPGHSLEEVVGENGRRAELYDRQRLLSELERLPRDFCVGADGSRISPEQALNSSLRNESVYLVRKSALEMGLKHMPTTNAQGEQYLTDAIGAILAARDGDGLRFRGGCVPIEDAQEVMSYNNPEELLRIEDHFRGRKQRSHAMLSERLGPDRYRTIDEWLRLFPGDDQPLEASDDALASFYGDDFALILQRRTAYRNALLRFREIYGDERHAIIVRSPGRLNVMGRHIDWQGGRCNLMAVNQEVILVAAPRSDDVVEVRNVDPNKFPDARISLGQLVSQLDWDDWLSCVNSEGLERHLRLAAGKWSIYIEAALLRLQMAFRDRTLSGMDIVVDGNIPIAAGMSSSSALVVSTAETTLALNGLDVTPSQFVNFCGEGEWFVGTRGGSADHAAMKFGQKGTINHVQFHDFELLEQLRLPDSHRIVVCNSFLLARKAAGAKAAFNSRVGSYLVGVELVRHRFPQYAPFVRFVRDVNPKTLRIPLSKIYEILIALPESMTAEEIRQTFLDKPESWDRLAPMFTDVEPSREHPVRGVVMFGITECARSREAAECLRRGEMRALGELMTTSHDGERCFRVDDEGNAVEYRADISHEFLNGLIDDLASNSPERVSRAQLHRQPGAYRCSTREIDSIVDVACRTPGVLGAQIAGAGLGGCAMALVETDAVGALERRLVELFYRRHNLPSGVIKCTPASGSCVVSVPVAVDSQVAVPMLESSTRP